MSESEPTLTADSDHTVDSQPTASQDESCQGNPDRHAHTWAAEPTGDDPYRHVCIKCGDTLTEDPPTA